MKGNRVLQWFVLVIWLGLLAVGIIAEICAFHEIFVDINTAAELLFWAALCNVPFLAGMMAVITVIRRDHSVRVAPESAIVFALGFFGQIIGAAAAQKGELDSMGFGILAWWAILAQYGSFLWMIGGPRILRRISGLASQ